MGTLSHTYVVTDFLIETSIFYCCKISRNRRFNLKYRQCFVLAVLRSISHYQRVHIKKWRSFCFRLDLHV